MSNAPCCYCGKSFDRIGLRPYGPGGKLTCYACAHATPEREAATDAAMATIMDAAEAASPVDTILITDAGPEPYDPTAHKNVEFVRIRKARPKDN